MLKEEDYAYLKKLETDDYHVNFGASVLLDDYESSKWYYDRFTFEEKSSYQKYPIYTLFLKLRRLQ